MPTSDNPNTRTSQVYYALHHAGVATVNGIGALRKPAESALSAHMFTVDTGGGKLTLRHPEKATPDTMKTLIGLVRLQDKSQRPAVTLTYTEKDGMHVYDAFVSGGNEYGKYGRALVAALTAADGDIENAKSVKIFKGGQLIEPTDDHWQQALVKYQADNMTIEF